MVYFVRFVFSLLEILMSFLVFVTNMTSGIGMLTSIDDDDDVDVYV